MKKSQKGFTIIEVALVLAIGALIFLVVFLAVPALQRNQRNDARKRDVSNVVEAVTNFYANNPGQNITTGVDQYTGAKGDGTKQIGKYIDTLSNNTTKVMTSNSGPMPGYGNETERSTITILVGKKCDGLQAIKSGTNRSAAVVGIIENATGYEYYCSDAS